MLELVYIGAVKGNGMADKAWTNWSGGVKARPADILEPADEGVLVTQVKAAGAPIRVVGAGHSFTPLCETSGSLFSLSNMSGLMWSDEVTKRVRVRAGTRIRDMGPLLHEVGLGLVNQGDIDSQAIAGAVGTGTHGTGKALGSLSAGVTGFRLVMPSGEVVSCSRDENTELFHAGRVAMGGLGIMSEVELQCRSAYALEERGGRMPVSELFSSLDALCRDNRHFEFFWFPYADEVLVKTLNEVDGCPAPRRRGPDGVDGPGDVVFRRLCDITRFAPFMRSRYQRRMTKMAGARYCGDEAGRVRWSHDAFPSDRNVRFNEMEYAVSVEKGPDCVQEVAAHMRTCGANFLFPIEYRYVAADDAWLSPFYERDSVTISIHQYHKQAYKKLFNGVEAIFRRYGGRPHWGKLHTLAADDLRELYPKWDTFCDVRKRVDQEGRMLNPFLKRLFGVS